MPKDISAPRRGFSFKDFSLSQPGQPLPGDRLDTELDRLVNKLGEFEAFLLTSFERDGSLKGGSVKARNLQGEILDPLLEKVRAAGQSALQVIEDRERSTQNLATEALTARTQAKTAAQEAKDAAQEARSLNQQADQAAQAANQARARSEAALIPLSASQASAETAANSARIAEDMAYRWANKLDGPVFVPNGGDPVDDGFFSARYYAVSSGRNYADIFRLHGEVQAWHFEIETVFYPEVKALHFDFRSNYYGSFPTPPALDPFGNPPTSGDLYFDSSAEGMFVWNAVTDTWDSVSAGAGSLSRFTQLTDVPNDYAGARGRVPMVNTAEDALVFGSFLPIAGGTLTGFLTLSASPTALLHAATKGYVDTQDSALNTSLRAYIDAQVAPRVQRAGDAMTGFLSLHADPAQPAHAVTKRYSDAQDATLDAALRAYADSQVATRLPLSGGQMTGQIKAAGSPVAPEDLGSKGYIDAQVATRLTQAQADARFLRLAGGTLTGPLVLSGPPTQALNPASKAYVDALIADIQPPPGTHIGATPPANPQPGQLWFRTTAPVGLYVWINDGDSSQWVQTQGGGSFSQTGRQSLAATGLTHLTFDQVPANALWIRIAFNNLVMPAGATLRLDYAGFVATYGGSRQLLGAAYAPPIDNPGSGNFVLDVAGASNSGYFGTVNLDRLATTGHAISGNFRRTPTEMLTVAGRVINLPTDSTPHFLRIFASAAFTGGGVSVSWGT